MGRFAAILYLVLAPTLMGISIMIVLFIPALTNDQMKLMLPAVAVGGILAIPLSLLIAKKISSNFKT